VGFLGVGKGGIARCVKKVWDCGSEKWGFIAQRVLHIILVMVIVIVILIIVVLIVMVVLLRFMVVVLRVNVLMVVILMIVHIGGHVDGGSIVLTVGGAQCRMRAAQVVVAEVVVAELIVVLCLDDLEATSGVVKMKVVVDEPPLGSGSR
jgi:hypothetical protein